MAEPSPERSFRPNTALTSPEQSPESQPAREPDTATITESTGEEASSPSPTQTETETPDPVVQVTEQAAETTEPSQASQEQSNEGTWSWICAVIEELSLKSSVDDDTTFRGIFERVTLFS